eukprot:jgi/Chlat1/4504/Chrsp29S04439
MADEVQPRVGDPNSSDPMERIRAGGSRGGQIGGPKGGRARAEQLGHDGYVEMGTKGGQTVKEMAQRAAGDDEAADETKAAKDKIMPPEEDN